MILVQAESTGELELMARVVAGARQRGAGELLDDVRFVFIGRHPSSALANLLDEPAPVPDVGLMTRHDAARALSCSPSTIDRRAAAGRLCKVDGRITAASVAEYLRGES